MGQSHGAEELADSVSDESGHPRERGASVLGRLPPGGFPSTPPAGSPPCRAAAGCDEPVPIDELLGR
jgi:hypothetical protein